MNAAVYHIDWSDVQTSKLLSCGVAYIENAGSAVSDGIEIGVVSRPTDDVDFTVGASYNVAELKDDAPNLGGIAGDPIPGVLPQISVRVIIFLSSAIARHSFTAITST